MEEIFTTAWNYYKQHWKFLVIVAAVGVVLATLIMTAPIIYIYTRVVLDPEGAAKMFEGMGVGTLVGYGAMILMGSILYALTSLGLTKASLKITKGETPSTYQDALISLGTFLKMVGASIVVGLGIMICSLLCVIPGFIFAFFCMFVFIILIDNPNTGIIDAIKKSMTLFKANWQTALIVTILLSILSTMASSVAVVGTIAALPFTALAQVVMYRMFNGELTVNDNNNVPPPLQ